MAFDCAATEVERTGDFNIALPFDDEFENLTFSGCKFFNRLRKRGSRLHRTLHFQNYSSRCECSDPIAGSFCVAVYFPRGEIFPEV